MVIGENAKAGDLEVNPVRAKEKTNMRYAHKIVDYIVALMSFLPALQ
jgi:predicted membrane GTPase involved in stress response